MAGITTTTTLTELVPQFTSEARMWFVDNSLFYIKSGIAKQFLQWADLRNEAGVTATFPKFGAIAFGDATEGQDYTAVETLDTSGPGSVTATEHVVNVVISDMAVKATIGGENALIAKVGEAIGMAAASKFDADVMALFSSLGATPTGGPSTGAKVTQSSFRADLAALQSVPMPEPYAAFFHPKGWNDFIGESSSPLLNAAASDSIAKQIWGGAYTTDILGVRCFKHSKIPAETTVDYVGAFMSAYAIGCTWKGDLKIETQRDATLRGTEFVATMTYGVGVIDSTAGYVMRHDYS